MDNSNSDDDNESTASSVEEIDTDNVAQNVPTIANNSLLSNMLTVLSHQINHDMDRSITPPVAMLNPDILRVLLLHRTFDEMMNENMVINEDEEPIFWGEEQAIANSFYDRSPIRHVIAEHMADDILKTKKYIHVENREEHSKCPISLEYFKDDDDVIQLPCNHCFFEEPIRQWLMNDSHVCPICRFSFESMEININEQQSNNDGEEDEASEAEENAIEDSDAAEDAINNDEEPMDIDDISFSDEEKNDDYDNHQNIDEIILYNETQTFFDYDEAMSVSSENSDEYFFNEDYDSVD
jgi:hypothetical protein